MSETDKKSDNLNAAQKLLTELRSNYIRDLPAQFDEVEELVMSMGDSDGIRSAYEDLYRRVHSLKGTAGTYGLQIITAICHQLEDYLNQVSSHPDKESGNFLDTALQFVDLLRKTQEDISKGQTSFPDIEAALGVIKSGLTQKTYSGLIIDSSRTGVDMALQLLSDSPIHFSVATDGLTALERLLSEPFDILITGMQIPRLNGAALISAVRMSAGLNSHIKSLLISSSTLPNLTKNIEPDRIMPRDANFMEQLIVNVDELIAQLDQHQATG